MGAVEEKPRAFVLVRLDGSRTRIMRAAPTDARVIGLALVAEQMPWRLRRATAIDVLFLGVRDALLRLGMRLEGARS